MAVRRTWLPPNKEDFLGTPLHERHVEGMLRTPQPPHACHGSATPTRRTQHMDDIFGELIEEIAEETAEEIGGEVAEEVVEGLFD